MGLAHTIYFEFIITVLSLQDGTVTTHVRYTGESMTYNLGGILGGPLPPFAITYLMGFEKGIYYVGYYLAIVGIISFIAITFSKETKDVDLMDN